jgi:hypothetical protein
MEDPMRPYPLWSLLFTLLFVSTLGNGCDGGGDDPFGIGQPDDDDNADDDDDVTDDDDDDDDTGDDDTGDDDTGGGDDDDTTSGDDDDATGSGEPIEGSVTIDEFEPTSEAPWTVVLSVYADVDFEPKSGPTGDPISELMIEIKELPFDYVVMHDDGVAVGIGAYLDDNGSGAGGPDAGDLVGWYGDYVAAPASEVDIKLGMVVE